MSDARQRALEIARAYEVSSLEYVARHADDVQLVKQSSSYTHECWRILRFRAGAQEFEWELPDTDGPGMWCLGDSSKEWGAERIANWIAAHALERQERCVWEAVGERPEPTGGEGICRGGARWQIVGYRCKVHGVAVYAVTCPERCPGAKR